MRLIGKSKLVKYVKKNKGNHILQQCIQQLISDIELIENPLVQLKEIRRDADCVHPDGFYFFNISVHRTLILIEMDEDGEAIIVWIGSHDAYDRTFRNNKATIEKWLRINNYLD